MTAPAHPTSDDTLLARTDPSPGSTDALGWSDIALVIEGLAFSARPLKAATREVTARYALGPRGTFILSLIANGLRYPADISQTLMVGRSLVTAELGRLTDAGLISARPGARDRRRSELALTPRGRAACDEVRAEMARLIRHNLGDYSRAQIELFACMLRDARKVDGEADPALTSRLGPAS